MRVTTHKEAYIRLRVKSGAPRALWFGVYRFHRVVYLLLNKAVKVKEIRSLPVPRGLPCPRDRHRRPATARAPEGHQHRY